MRGGRRVLIGVIDGSRLHTGMRQLDLVLFGAAIRSAGEDAPVYLVTADTLRAGRAMLAILEEDAVHPYRLYLYRMSYLRAAVAALLIFR